MYTVEDILAEKELDGRTVYLIRWMGYPIERATWEPIESFGDPEQATSWRETTTMPNFDWKKFDRDREREKVEKQERHERRVAKRKRLGIRNPSSSKRSGIPAERRLSKQRQGKKKRSKSTLRRASPVNDSDLSDFVVDDNVIEYSSEDSLPDENFSDGHDTSRRGRKKRPRAKPKKTALDEIRDLGDSESDSDGDLPMRDAPPTRRKSMGGPKPAPKQRQQQSKLKSQSTVRKPVSRPASPPPRTTTKPVKKRTGSPVDLNKQAVKKRPLPPPVLATTADTSRAKPKTSNPRDPSPVDTNNPALYDGLTKRYRNQRFHQRRAENMAPDPTAAGLQLFRPADELAKRMSGAHITNPPKSRIDDIGMMDDPKPPTVKSKPPSQRRQSGTGTRTSETLPMKEPDPSKVEPSKPPPKKFTLGDIRSSRPDLLKAKPKDGSITPGSILAQKTPSIQQPSLPEASHNASTIALPTMNDQVIKIHVVFGENNSMGMVKMEGFSPELMRLMAKRPATPTGPGRLEIKLSLENSYIAKYFVGEWGLPLENAEVYVNDDLYDPFISALSTFKGAGVCLTEGFTLFFFLPSNEVLKKAFNLPMARKCQLRVVAYPPVHSSTLRLNEMRYATEQPQHAPYADGFKHLLPELFYKATLLDVRRFEDVTRCIIYCPEVAIFEQTELETVLKTQGLPESAITRFSAIPSATTELTANKSANCVVFVHAALRDKLHLLPHINKIIRLIEPTNLKRVQWHFFGMAYNADTSNRSTIQPQIPNRFWMFGTLILFTPEFVVHHHTLALELMENHRNGECISICLPRNFRQRVTNTLIELVEDKLEMAPVRANAVYEAISKMERSSSTGDVPVESTCTGSLSTTECDAIMWLDEFDKKEHVPGTSEYEFYVDRFVYLQQTDRRFQRYVVCHAEEEITGEDLYGSVSFPGRRWGR